MKCVPWCAALAFLVRVLSLAELSLHGQSLDNTLELLPGNILLNQKLDNSSRKCLQYLLLLFGPGG